MEKPRYKIRDFLELKDKLARRLKTLNSLFIAIFVLTLIANIYVIVEFKVNNYTPNQAVSGFVKTGFNIINGVFKPQLKSTNGYTAILVMGIDVRQGHGGFDGKNFIASAGDGNVDAMIQVVINNKTGDVSMFSVDRDTGVTMTEACVNQSGRSPYKSINYGYKFALAGNCPQGGVAVMEKYVTSITGFENNYYAMVSYQAFKDIINLVGDEQNGQKGLYINVEHSFHDLYPREVGGGYEGVYFKQGNQFITTNNLLKYSRVREETSEFDRVHRMSQVAQAVEAKLLGTTFSDPQQLLTIYESFKKNALFSDINIDELTAGVELAKNVSVDKIHRYVLDDNFVGTNVLLTKPFWSNPGTHHRVDGYYLSPVDYKNPECLALKDEYCKVKQYTAEIVANPDLQAEQPIIYAYTTIPEQQLINAQYINVENQFKLPIVYLNKPQYVSDWGNQAVKIYDFTNGTKPLTSAKLALSFNTKILIGNSSIKHTTGEDFVIFVKPN